MGRWIEQARVAQEFHNLGLGTSYRETVAETVIKQRNHELVPFEVAEPFERIFILNDEESRRVSDRRGRLVFDLPNASYEPSGTQLVFEVQIFSGISWALRKVYTLHLRNIWDGQEYDLTQGLGSVGYSRRESFGCNPYDGQLSTGVPDNYGVLSAIGHERTHVKDEVFKDPVTGPLLARAILKKTMYGMVNGRVGIPFARFSAGDKLDYVRDNLEITAGDYLSRAKMGVEQIMGDPVTKEELDLMLEAEERACGGGLAELAQLMDQFGFDGDFQVELMRGAEQMAVDDLATYVWFADAHEGKAVGDWVEEANK